MYVRFGCFVDGIDRFDSGAFRLPYAEAAALDPQARILLEQTHVSVLSVFLTWQESAVTSESSMLRC